MYKRKKKDIKHKSICALTIRFVKKPCLAVSKSVQEAMPPDYVFTVREEKNLVISEKKNMLHVKTEEGPKRL